MALSSQDPQTLSFILLSDVLDGFRGQLLVSLVQMLFRVPRLFRDCDETDFEEICPEEITPARGKEPNYTKQF
jgi:hypothetical protein